ncbi:hypothetical protein [Aureimonas sp. AU4]|uniref:hypothetical protein n=1 Tax=Aureimonas sp. AU4 TaxID=1638163 RepID=UPI0012E3557F|nr:hypothetical protein [Aureimonas sp. AU4]
MSAFALGLLAAPPALAQAPAPIASAGSDAAKPPEGVAALRRTLEAYLTAVPFERGLLRLETDPAGQRLTIDPAPVLTDLLGSPVRFRPLRFVLAERSDGNWDVAGSDAIDIETAPAAQGRTQTFLYRQDSQSFRGVFSPSLAAFLEGELRASGTRNEQNDAVSRSVATIDSTAFTTSARPNAAGGADIEFRQRYEGLKQTTTIQVPEAAGTPFQSIGLEVNAAGVQGEGQIEGVRSPAIRDLYALVLRNAEALEADPHLALAGPFGAELKSALREVLPVWANLSASASADALRLSSPYGILTVGEARQDLRFSGVEGDAGFDLDVTLSGIDVASPLLPAWTATLLPQEMKLGFAMSGIDLAAPADIALREVDFRQDPPLSPDAQARVTAAFDLENLRSVLKPGSIRARDYDIAFSGALTVKDAKPEARIALDVGGLDRAIATLQGAAAAQPDLFQTVGMLQFAKGIGRPRDDGRLEWIVEAGADGSVSVNGTMLKGPDPVAPPPGDDDPAGDAPAGATDL